MEFLGGLLLLAICFSAYFLPSIVGYNKKKANAICVLNLFLGWTFVGWVVALVWAVADEKHVKIPESKFEEEIDVSSIKSVTEEIKELKALLDDGLITDEEFEKSKRMILEN